MNILILVGFILALLFAAGYFLFLFFYSVIDKWLAPDRERTNV